MTVLRVRTHHLHVRTIGGAGADGGEGPDVATALGRIDLPEPDGLWFIDRIDARVCVRDDLGGRAGADLLAREIACAVRGVVHGDRHQDGVRWFPDRAAYLAQWLTDLSAGHAAEHWEYAQLGTGDFSSAVRERAEAEPATLLAALRALPDTDVDRMAELFAPGDAAAMVHAIATGTGPVDRVAVARALRQLWGAGRLPRDPRRATMTVLLRIGHPDALPDPASAAAARDLVLLCCALREGDPAHRDALITAASSADAHALTALGHSTLAAALLSWPEADRRSAVAALTDDPAPTGRAGPATERTTLGGMFLLLPLLAELPLEDATAGWPAAPPDGRAAASEPATAAALTGALAIGAVLGVGFDVLSDPWARLALGLPSEIAGHVVGWSHGVATAGTDRFTARFSDVAHQRALAVTGDLTEPSLLLDPPLATHVACAVRVAAALLARELSHRLPGQLHAGLGHLRRNVLTCGASVRTDDAAIVVELDPPPLAVLLSLTGMSRRRFVLPATGERPWVLTQRS